MQASKHASRHAGWQTSQQTPACSSRSAWATSMNVNVSPTATTPCSIQYVSNTSMKMNSTSPPPRRPGVFRIESPLWTTAVYLLWSNYMMHVRDCNTATWQHVVTNLDTEINTWDRLLQVAKSYQIMMAFYSPPFLLTRLSGKPLLLKLQIGTTSVKVPISAKPPKTGDMFANE